MPLKKTYNYSILHIITNILELFIDMTLYLIGTIECLVEALDMLDILLHEMTKSYFFEELDFIYHGLCTTN